MRSMLAIVAAIAGVASHLFHFIRGEHHFNGIRYLLAALLSPGLLFYALVSRFGDEYFDAALTTTAVWWAFFGSLWSSILIYRAFFHRLHAFPGPFSYKLSKFAHAKKSTGFKNYLDLEEFHQKYGDFVRTGPNEITIFDPAATELIYGPGSKCSKSMFYDIGFPNKTMHLCRDKALHDKRRKTVWDRAFNSKSIRSYDKSVTFYADQLMSQFRNKEGKPFDIHNWCTFYSADVLFDLAFGKPFDMVKDGKGHWFIDLMQDGLQHLAYVGTLPWIQQIVHYVPFAQEADKKGVQWTRDKARERAEMKDKDDDIMSHILNPLQPISTDPSEIEKWVTGDTRLLIIAGTDTTAGTLLFAFYRLCKHPEQAEKIRQELLQHGLDQEFSVAKLQNCTHLCAFVDEVLRLHPAVPDGLYRLTPPEGLQIGDTFVPGEVTVIVPTWSTHRSPNAWVHPDSFIPERWTTQPELILNKRSYAPFSLGPYACSGKQLALNEARTVVAKTLLEFDIAFAPYRGEDGSVGGEKEDGEKMLAEIKDYFVLGLAPLWVQMTER